MVCAINCDQIILIQLIYYFSLYSIIFHYFHYFYHCHHYSHFAAKSGTYLVKTLLYCSEVCFHLFHSICCYLCCFIPLGSTDHLVGDTAFGMQHTKFLGGMCNPVIFWVIFRSPRVTYYTGNMFGFKVNISYLYSFKLQIIVL